MWKKVGKSLWKRLDNIRYHCNDIGHDAGTNRTPDRAGETATDSTGGDASWEPERAVQRLRQARLPLQRSQESPEARALLPAQLYLARPGRHSFRAGRAAGAGWGGTRFVRAERLAEMRQKLANYKRFRELSEEWVDLTLELEQVDREQAR